MNADKGRALWGRPPGLRLGVERNAAAGPGGPAQTRASAPHHLSVKSGMIKLVSFTCWQSGLPHII